MGPGCKEGRCARAESTPCPGDKRMPASVGQSVAAGFGTLTPTEGAGCLFLAVGRGTEVPRGSEGLTPKQRPPSAARRRERGACRAPPGLTPLGWLLV